MAPSSNEVKLLINSGKAVKRAKRILENCVEQEKRRVRPGIGVLTPARALTGEVEISDPLSAGRTGSSRVPPAEELAVCFIIITSLCIQSRRCKL